MHPNNVAKMTMVCERNPALKHHFVFCWWISSAGVNATDSIGSVSHVRPLIQFAPYNNRITTCVTRCISTPEMLKTLPIIQKEQVTYKSYPYTWIRMIPKQALVKRRASETSGKTWILRSTKATHSRLRSTLSELYAPNCNSAKVMTEIAKSLWSALDKALTTGSFLFRK
jgi:hypothetical protein